MTYDYRLMTIHNQAMERQYWIIQNGIQAGPFTLGQLAQRGGLTPETPVWYDGLPDWTVAAELPEFAGLIGVAPRPAAAPAPAYAPGDPYARAAAADQTPPPTYLVWAILATVCCCVFTGIVAIVYSSKVTPAWQRGDYLAAKAASEKAGMWVIISFVAGLIWAPFSVLFSMMGSL